MASIVEIRLRMKSVKDIMKITNAMYLISSSKLKKARKKLQATEPYFNRIQSTISHILIHTPQIDHKFFDARNNIPDNQRKRGYIIMTADKGLAGAYNHNVLKLAEQELKKGQNNILFVIGQFGRHYFKKKNYNIDPEFLYTAQEPNTYRSRMITDKIIELFEKKELDEVYVIYTKMITSMTAEAEVLQVLPLFRRDFDEAPHNVNDHQFTTNFLPSPEQVMDVLVPNYVRGLIYGAMVEAYSSEHSARMTAMESATSSAKDMIKELSLLYNRARQSAITQEITEIVSGANSLKR